MPHGRRNTIPAQEEKPVMVRLAIAFVSALASVVASAQDSSSGQSHMSAVAGVNGTQPFLFDGRMRGDGVRKGTLTDDHHPELGAIVMPSPPKRE